MLRQAQPELEVTLAALATTGLQHDLHVMISANRWFDILPQLLDAIGTKLELRLGDPSETLSQRPAARQLPQIARAEASPAMGRFSSWLCQRGTRNQEPPWRQPTWPRWSRALRRAPLRSGHLASPRFPRPSPEDQVADLAVAAGSPPPDPSAGFLVGVGEFRTRPVQVNTFSAQLADSLSQAGVVDGDRVVFHPFSQPPIKAVQVAWSVDSENTA